MVWVVAGAMGRAAPHTTTFTTGRWRAVTLQEASQGPAQAFCSLWCIVVRTNLQTEACFTTWLDSLWCQLPVALLSGLPLDNKIHSSVTECPSFYRVYLDVLKGWGLTTFQKAPQLIYLNTIFLLFVLLKILWQELGENLYSWFFSIGEKRLWETIRMITRRYFCVRWNSSSATIVFWYVAL